MNEPAVKSVIGIVGSPRRGRNTATLVQKVLEGAASKGLPTELFYISDYHINPCDACDACMPTGPCAQKDDMHVFYSAFNRARVLVWGTPIYFDHVSAQTKLVLDRMYLYTGPDPGQRFPAEVKGVLVATWEARDPTAYDSVIAWFRERLSHYFGIETVAVLKAADTNRKPVRQRPELLAEAFRVGTELAKWF